MAKKKSIKEKKICQVEWCNKPSRKLGYCTRHYAQIKRIGKIIKTYVDRPSTICKVQHCRCKSYENDLCRKHFAQMEDTGKIEIEHKNKCRVSWCDVEVRSGEYCSRHTTQLYRYGKIIKTYMDRPKRICKVEGCNEPHSSNGYCSKHSMQILNNGKILNRTKYDPNEFRFDGDDCYISLYDKNCNFVAETVVDKEDYGKVKDYKWGLNTSGYVQRSQADEENSELYLSRFLLFPLKNTLLTIDHKDRNPLNNRKSNLRYATRSQNCANVESIKGSTSKYKGVGWNKNHKKWYSGICKDGKRINIGFFDNENHAAIAYNCMAIKLHGEFAYLNDIY